MSTTLRPPPPFSKLDQILEKIEELAVTQARQDERLQLLMEVREDVAQLKTDVAVLMASGGPTTSRKGAVVAGAGAAGLVSALAAAIPELVKLLK